MHNLFNKSLLLCIVTGLSLTAQSFFPIGNANDGCVGGVIFPLPNLRYGTFTCTLPAGAPGAYKVRLTFVDPSFSTPTNPQGARNRAFNVTVNGYQDPALKNFDPISAGGTKGVPFNQDTSVLSVDGNITIRLTTVIWNALLSSVSITPIQNGPGGGASQTSDLVDCKVTASGSTVTVSTPCSLKTGVVLHSLFMPATATLSGVSGTGTAYFYWSYGGRLVAIQDTAATFTCNIGCLVGEEKLLPQYSWPIASIDFTGNTFTTVNDMRGSYANNTYLCGGKLSCLGMANGTIVVDAGPDIITKAQLQSGQTTLCIDTGAVNSIVCSPSSPYNGYSNGMVVQVVPANANTGLVTIAISGLSAKPVKKADGVTDLALGDLVPGKQVPLVYDSHMVFRLMQQ